MANMLYRGDWRKRAAEVRRWKAIVALHFAKQRPEKPLTKANLTFVRCSSRRPDEDGLVSGFKAVQDGLVECGILADDSFEVIGRPTYGWKKAPKNGGSIYVLVEEGPDQNQSTSEREAHEIVGADGKV
jgi:Holliday junction resolvase RusA-like endonuclease